MKFCKQVFAYIFTNRRVIGTIVGASLTLFGYTDEGKFVENLGAI